MSNDWMRSRALDLTRRMVEVRSFTRTPAERDFAGYLISLVEEVGHGALEIGSCSVPNDGWGRSFVWAFLRGRSARTVILMCHYDTVDADDYGALAPFATQPDELLSRLSEGNHDLDPLTHEHLAKPDEWLFGRGTVDMKGGIAAHLTVMEALCRQAASRGGLPDGNLLFLCVPDEESESAGILAAVPFLSKMRAERGLEYLGAINTDYTSPLHDGDDTKAVYAGTVGKLLPSVYVRGLETHVGEPYRGYDADLLAAEIIRAISMRAELADSSGSRVAAPPVTLKFADFKDRYAVQTPFDAYLYVNYLTFRMTPNEVLAQMQGLVRDSLGAAIERIDSSHEEWARRSGFPPPQNQPSFRVLTYAELLRMANDASGAEQVTGRLNAELDGEGVDSRMRSAALVRELWNLLALQGPAAVVYFSPPYYPHSSGEREGPFLSAVRRVAGSQGSEVRSFYPYISDASYLGLEDRGDISALTSNMPLWSDEAARGKYSLPLDAIRNLDVSVVNVGMWGYGAHKREERLHIPYSCGTVPQLILETIRETLKG